MSRTPPRSMPKDPGGDHRRFENQSKRRDLPSVDDGPPKRDLPVRGADEDAGPTVDGPKPGPAG